jgi:hypothetical protein
LAEGWREIWLSGLGIRKIEAIWGARGCMPQWLDVGLSEDTRLTDIKRHASRGDEMRFACASFFLRVKAFFGETKPNFNKSAPSTGGQTAGATELQEIEERSTRR